VYVLYVEEQTNEKKNQSIQAYDIVIIGGRKHEACQTMNIIRNLHNCAIMCAPTSFESTILSDCTNATIDEKVINQV
jgi:hypothetical protein